MFDPQMELLLTVLVAVVAEPKPGADWGQARNALAACEGVEEDVARAVAAQDAPALRAIIGSWMIGKRHLLLHDREVLKRALKAYRKRLKVTVLDAESSIGGGPMSSGRRSQIVGITPPDRYPPPVWQELVRQGRLLDGRRGMYELPPE
jgi:hypothetical protein